LIKALKHLKPDEILLLLSLDPSESSLQGIKALKNFIGIPSGPQALKLGVENIALQISSSLLLWNISLITNTNIWSKAYFKSNNV